MSYPMKHSSSKPGRLTRQEKVISNASEQFQDTTTNSPSNQNSVNFKNSLLLQTELPKPMSKLPEIRLEDGGNGNKGLIEQMKPQKSCESYDSTASGMSWSSSQSTVALSGGGSRYRNSASVSGNLSYEEDELPISRMSPNASVMRKSPYPYRTDSSSQRGNPNFRTGYSFDEEHCECSTEEPGGQDLANDQADVFYENEFEGQEKNLEDEVPEIEITARESAKRKSFKRFWKKAFNAIISDFANENSDSKYRSSKNKDGKEEPEEIDPVYQLLKSAATQRHMSLKSYKSFDQTNELIHRPQSLSSSSRTSSISQRERSQPP